MANFANSTISFRNGEFIDVSAEATFAHSQLKLTQTQLRTALIFCSAVYMMFIVTDISVLGYTGDAFRLLLARTLVALTAAAGCSLLYGKPDSVAVSRLVACATKVVGMGAFLFLQRTRPHETPWHAMSLALMLLIVYLYIPNRLTYASVIAVAATCAFLAMVFAQQILVRHELLTMTMLLVLANTVGFIAARRYNVVWREQFQAQSILRNLSMQDPLTGCYNRQYLQQSLFSSEWARARRFKLQLTVIICDLDNFKSINDNYGHSVGDEVLVAFAKLLLNTTREKIDSVVRFGGEEFLLVLPETDRAGGAGLAERLRQAFEKSAVSPAKATASFGVASIDFGTTGSPSTMTELIAYADSLLYAAKKNGRNQVVCGDFS